LELSSPPIANLGVKFAIGRELSSKTTPSHFKMGASTIGNNTPISTIEAQIIPGGLTSKIAMGRASVSRSSTPYLGMRLAQLKIFLQHN